jgi:hypothetical protein
MIQDEFFYGGYLLGTVGDFSRDQGFEEYMAAGEPTSSNEWGSPTNIDFVLQPS